MFENCKKRHKVILSIELHHYGDPWIGRSKSIYATTMFNIIKDCCDKSGIEIKKYKKLDYLSLHEVHECDFKCTKEELDKFIYYICQYDDDIRLVDFQ